MAKMRGETYGELKNILDRSSTSMLKIGNNTWARLEDGNVVIQFHNTDIVRLHPDGRRDFRLGGFNTITTRERINQFIGTRYNRYLHSVDYVCCFRGIPLTDTYSWNSVEELEERFFS